MRIPLKNRAGGAGGSARRLIDALSREGVEPPKSVLDILDKAAALEDERRKKAAIPETAAVLLEKGHDKAVLAAQVRSVAGAMKEAYIAADKMLGDQALAGLRAEGAAITEALRPKALDLIEKLAAVAADPRDLGQLVRDGEEALADAAARFDVNAEALATLYELRDQIYGPRQQWGGEGTVFQSGVWRNYFVIDGELSTHAGAGERFRSGLRAGGELWFPTAAEAAANADELQAEHGKLARGIDARFGDQQAAGALKAMRWKDYNPERRGSRQFPNLARPRAGH